MTSAVDEMYRTTVDEPKFRGKLFHTVGPETEKARLPNFVLVLTVTTDLVVDERSRLLTESDSVKV